MCAMVSNGPVTDSQFAVKLLYGMTLRTQFEDFHFPDAMPQRADTEEYNQSVLRIYTTSDFN